MPNSILFSSSHDELPETPQLSGVQKDSASAGSTDPVIETHPHPALIAVVRVLARLAALESAEADGGAP